MGLISEGMVAKKLGVARQTVQQLRYKGKMPPYVVIDAGKRKNYAYDENLIDQFIVEGKIGKGAGRPKKLTDPVRFILFMEREDRDLLKETTANGRMNDLVRGLICAHLEAVSNGKKTKQA